MTNKVKKPHTIKVVGVSCINGKEYKLNVSGRNLPLQLFQCAVPGETVFRFVVLPHAMSKRDAVVHLMKQPASDHPQVHHFLNTLLAKYDAKLNKVPGKRGRPKGSKNKVKAEKLVKNLVKAGAKVKKAEATKMIKAMIEPVEIKTVLSDADKQAQMEANREKLRKVAQQMKQKVG